jgi:hypothetical protein
MLLAEDVVMNPEENRFPSRPAREAPLPQTPSRPEEECQAADETLPFPVSPPPIPWPRVFPSL